MMVLLILKAVSCLNPHAFCSLTIITLPISSYMIVIIINIMLGLEGPLLLFAVVFGFHQPVRLLAKCVTCKRVTGPQYALPMSPELPLLCNDTSTRSISNVGIDFAGPLTLKDRSGTHFKVYICLFTCLTTRAINLEVVEDLSTSSFLQALWNRLHSAYTKGSTRCKRHDKSTTNWLSARLVFFPAPSMLSTDVWDLVSR